MKNCPKCNREIGDVKYCNYCGAKIDTLSFIFNKSNSLLKQNVKLDDVDLYETKNDEKKATDNGNFVDQQSISKDSMIFEKAPEAPAPVIEAGKCEDNNSELDVTDNHGAENSKIQEILPIETPSLSETKKTAVDINGSDHHENENVISDDELEITETDTETNDEIGYEETENQDTPFELSDLFVSKENEAEELAGAETDTEASEEIVDEEAKNQDVPFELSGLFVPKENVAEESADAETDTEANDEIDYEETDNQYTPFELTEVLVSQDHATSGECCDDDNKENEIPSGIISDITEKVEEVFETVSQDIVTADVNNKDSEESNHYVAESYADDEKQELPIVTTNDSVIKENADNYEKRIPISDIDQMFGDAPTFDIESIKKSYLNAQKELNKTQKKKKSFFKSKRQ